MPVTSKYDNALPENRPVSGLLWTRLTILGQWNSIKKVVEIAAMLYASQKVAAKAEAFGNYHPAEL